MKFRNFKISLDFIYACVLVSILYMNQLSGPDASAVNKSQIEQYKNAAQFVNANIKTEKQAPQIAITFDDGPNAKFTPLLLEGLKARGVEATFFLIGVNIVNNEEVVLQMYEEGHLIGNHTYNHVEITKLSDEEALQELVGNSDLIKSITGQETEYVRPPFGVWQKELETKLDIIPVMWSVDPLDWTTENVNEIVNNVVTEVEEGDIILLHDCYDSSVEAALRIIDILQKEGYEFVTVDELILN